MKTRSFILFAIMLFLTLFENTSNSKENNAVRKTTRLGKAKINSLPLIPFQIDTEKLPPNFKDTDITKLFSTFMLKAPLEKKEFETTADYEQKIKKAVNDNVYAFKLEPETPFGSLTLHSYDADAQKLQLTVETTNLSKYSFENHRIAMIIKHINKGSGYYMGSNAFGARVPVEKVRSIQYGITVVNEKAFGPSSGSIDGRYKTLQNSIKAKTLEINIPPAQAKALKNNIGVLLLCKPVLCRVEAGSQFDCGMPVGAIGNDLIFEYTYYSSPTIDEPTEVIYKRKFISVELLAIWIYDIKTGSIILKEELK